MVHKSDREEAKKRRRGRGAFASVTLLVPLLREVERVVEELGYWPRRAQFIHEAIMEKLEKYKKEIEARREKSTGTK